VNFALHLIVFADGPLRVERTFAPRDCGLGGGHREKVEFGDLSPSGDIWWRASEGHPRCLTKQANRIVGKKVNVPDGGVGWHGSVD
jgi:hypothetical protein